MLGSLHKVGLKQGVSRKNQIREDGEAPQITVFSSCVHMFSFLHTYTCILLRVGGNTRYMWGLVTSGGLHAYISTGL